MLGTALKRVVRSLPWMAPLLQPENTLQTAFRSISGMTLREPMPLYVVDAFVRPEHPTFSGNPAAVVMLTGAKSDQIPDEKKQQIAAQMNLSETAFVTRREGTEFDIQWFSPTNEVALCGHATLASAFAVRQHFRESLDATTLKFHTKSSGMLTVSWTLGSEKLSLSIGAPSPPEQVSPAEYARTLQAFPNIQKALSSVHISRAARKLLVVVSNPGWVRDMPQPPSAELLASHSGEHFRGVMLSAQEFGRRRIVSRYFAPWNGIPEDPVNGAGHALLWPFWSLQLEGDGAVESEFASPRGGFLECCECEGEVLLLGHCRLVVQGQLHG